MSESVIYVQQLRYLEETKPKGKLIERKQGSFLPELEIHVQLSATTSKIEFVYEGGFRRPKP